MDEDTPNQENNSKRKYKKLIPNEDPESYRKTNVTLCNA